MVVKGNFTAIKKSEYIWYRYGNENNIPVRLWAKAKEDYVVFIRDRRLLLKMISLWPTQSVLLDSVIWTKHLR